MAGQELGVRGELPDLIARILDGDPNQPWCVHRIYEEVISPDSPYDRRSGLSATREAADRLVHDGRAQFETVSAISIGVHCEDALYWSLRSSKKCLDDFGPEYESPTILRRLASHFQCHGL
jgi:hypothetical protein